MSPLGYHDIRLRLALRLLRPLAAALLAALIFVGAGLVGANDFEDAQIAAQIAKEK